MKNVSFSQICITDGFWKEMQKKNCEKTIPAVKKRFLETGRFAAFKCNWKEGEENKPHFFWESDVAKWIEGVSYAFMTEENKEKYAKELELIDGLIDEIETNRWADGYFNIYYTVVDPENRWSDRKKHELYCAGHLIEAAIAYKAATGKDKFLRCMIRYADCIYQTFVEENSAAFRTPGHPEIELALLKLYKETNDKKYLTLAEFFIEERGKNDKDFAEQESYEERTYDQSHLPVREQKTAEGHAVRACYLYCAMAELAEIKQDRELAEVCKMLFRNIVEKRMYITGGIGSTHTKEAFTIDYDLPNREAYSETCASISLAMLAQRMMKLEPDAMYADIIEKIIYNAGISGLSLSGDRFFYENPLELPRALSERDNKFMEHYAHHFALRKRAKIFECSCCPPNINRFYASIGDYLFGEDADTVYVNQFMNCTATLDKGAKLAITTAYPLGGNVRVNYTGNKKVAVRLPSWCTECHTNQPYEMKHGYMVFERAEELELVFEMHVMMIRAASEVVCNSGCVAIQRGPVVYCAESIDNGAYLGDLSILAHGKIRVERDKLTGLTSILAEGIRQKPQQKLYSRYEEDIEACTIKLIPYFAFANREDGEMKVWMRVR